MEWLFLLNGVKQNVVYGSIWKEISGCWLWVKELTVRIGIFLETTAKAQLRGTRIWISEVQRTENGQILKHVLKVKQGICRWTEGRTGEMESWDDQFGAWTVRETAQRDLRKIYRTEKVGLVGDMWKWRCLVQWRLMSLTQARGRQRYARGKGFNQEDVLAAAGKARQSLSLAPGLSQIGVIHRKRFRDRRTGNTW